MLLRLAGLTAAFLLTACDPSPVITQDSPDFQAAWSAASDSPDMVSGTYGPTAEGASVDVVELHAHEGWVQVQSGGDVWAYAIEPTSREVVFVECAEDNGVRQVRLSVVDDPERPLSEVLGSTAPIEITLDPCVDGALDLWVGDERTPLGLL